MYQNNSDAEQQAKETDSRSNAYIKQMRPVAPGYLALWDPTPWKSKNYQQVAIGDVGVIQEGQFRRLFNITYPGAPFPNSGRVPSNFEPIQFNVETDTDTRLESAVVEPYVLYSGGRLMWERVDEGREERTEEEDKTQQMIDASSEPNRGDTLPKPDECAPESQDNPNADPKSMSLRYNIIKTTGSKTTAYALVAPALIEEQVLVQRKLDDWKMYMEKHHKEWIKYAEFQFDEKMKPDDIILVRGWVKTKKWVIATMDSPGKYSLDIETAGYMQATLKLDNREVVGGVRCGSDRSSAQERKLRDLAAQMGQNVDPEFTTPRTRCLFILGLKLEKDFWAPKRIVAAAEPQDPKGSSGRDHDPASIDRTLHTLESPTSPSYAFQRTAPITKHCVRHVVFEALLPSRPCMARAASA